MWSYRHASVALDASLHRKETSLLFASFHFISSHHVEPMRISLLLMYKKKNKMSPWRQHPYTKFKMNSEIQVKQIDRIHDHFLLLLKSCDPFIYIEVKKVFSCMNCLIPSVLCNFNRSLKK